MCWVAGVQGWKTKVREFLGIEDHWSTSWIFSGRFGGSTTDWDDWLSSWNFPPRLSYRGFTIARLLDFCEVLGKTTGWAMNLRPLRPLRFGDEVPNSETLHEFPFFSNVPENIRVIEQCCAIKTPQALHKWCLTSTQQRCLARRWDYL